MARISGVPFVAAAACAIALAIDVPVKVAQTPAPAVPTFTKDVAPILFANCVACHRPGEIAPMSLLTYDEARPWARAIKSKVLAHEMPPWPADPQFGRFRNERRLTVAQIETLVSWVDAGAPRGDGDPPRPPKFVEGWTTQMGRRPDLVINAPLAFDLPASGEIPAFTVWGKLPFRDERFVEAIELRPTNRAIVHHATLFLARLPRNSKLGKAEAWPGGPIVDGIPVLRDGTRAPLPPDGTFGTPLVFYVPAGGVLRFPEGVVKRMQPEDYLMWSFHLVPSGKVDRAAARIGVWFSKTDVDHEAVTRTVTDRIFVNGNEIPKDPTGPRFPNIAPHDANYTITGLGAVNDDLTLYALWPHMHLRGRDMTFSVVDPQGREQTVLRIPRYDFSWQFTYELETPLKIKAGSIIKAIAHYDNSAANRFNPDPNQEVIWGQQTMNEMFNPFLELVYDKQILKGPAPLRSDCDFANPSDPTSRIGSPGLSSRCP